MEEALLTTDQVARYLNVDKFTIYRLVAQKRLPAYKVGNQWRFNERQVNAWLKKNMNVSEGVKIIS